MKVIKTRSSAYHTDRECMGLKKARRSVKEIDLDVALAWDMDLCSRCREGHVKENLDREWARRIRIRGY